MFKYKKPNVKISNRLAVYNFIKDCQEQTTSKPEISNALRLSDPTVMKIVSYLIEKGIIDEIGEAETTSVGRKPNLIKLNPSAGFSVGYNYDGVQLQCTIVDLNGLALKNETQKIKITLSELIASFIPETLAKARLDFDKCLGLGIALPTSVNVNTLRLDKPNPALNTAGQLDYRASVKELERKIGLKVILENDVNAASYSVLSQTSKHSISDDFIYIMLGEGIGAGLFLDGKLRRGANYSAGEIAYMFPELSIDAYTENYEKLLSISSIKQSFGLDLYSDDSIFVNNPMLLSYYGKILAQLIHNMGTLLDVDTFILGGYTVEFLGKPLLDFIVNVTQKFKLRPVNINMAENRYDISSGMGMMVTESRLHLFLEE